MRAAVRFATVMPSPMNRMTFFADLVRGVPKTSQLTDAVRSPDLASTL